MIVDAENRAKLVIMKKAFKGILICIAYMLGYLEGEVMLCFILRGIYLKLSFISIFSIKCDLDLVYLMCLIAVSYF